MSDLTIIPAEEKDFDAVFDIFRQVVSKGETYIYPEGTTKEEAHAIWMQKTAPYVAWKGGQIVGTYTIRPNKIGRGSHVCNAGFMVHPAYQKQGIGKAMGEHALKEARRLGYEAMQFNVVVSTNHHAVYLWKSLGFTVIGTVPKAFNHVAKGLVDIYIMHRFL